MGQMEHMPVKFVSYIVTFHMSEWFCVTLFGRNFKNITGKCVLLVLGISATHSKEYVERKGGSHDFVKFSFTI